MTLRIPIPKLERIVKYRDEQFPEIHSYVNGQLTTTQILHIVWTIICMSANILLILILQRKKYKQKNFYLIITSWCMANILFMALWLYFGIVPEEHMILYQSTFYYTIGAIILTTPSLHAPLIVTDYILKSTKNCRYAIFAIWGIALISLTITTVAILLFKYWVTPHVIVSIGLLHLLIIFIFFKIVCDFKHSDVENPILRISLSSTCIFINAVHWLLQWLHHFNEIDRFDLDISIAFLYGSSIVNLVLFTCLDEEVNVNLHESLKKIEYKSMEILGLKREPQEISNENKIEIQTLP